MKNLNSKYRQILWLNVIILSGGVGIMVYLKTHNILAAMGVGGALAVAEYFVMGYSLAGKQRREQEQDQKRNSS